MIFYKNTQLLYLFIQNYLSSDYLLRLRHHNMSVYTTLHSFIFRRTFWSIFYKIFTKDLGAYSSNLTKATQFIAIKQLIDHISLRTRVTTTKTPHSLDIMSVKYQQPIVLVMFAFNTSYYNTFTFYLFFMLSNMYNTPRNYFKLHYTFILYTPSFAIYPFINLFYFKLRHY